MATIDQLVGDWSGSGSDGAWVQVSPRPDCVVVTVGGEVDVLSAGKLAKALQTVASEYRTPCLIIDMSQLDFIDSTGLGVLIHVQNRARALGESMLLVHPPPFVEQLLLGTRLSDLFIAYDTLYDALAALSS